MQVAMGNEHARNIFTAKALWMNRFCPNIPVYIEHEEWETV